MKFLKLTDAFSKKPVAINLGIFVVTSIHEGLKEPEYQKTPVKEESIKYLFGFIPYEITIVVKPGHIVSGSITYTQVDYNLPQGGSYSSLCCDENLEEVLAKIKALE